MAEPDKLFLVRPEDQPAPDANIQAIAKYISWILSWLHVQKIYLTKVLNSGLPDLIEIWYWFDEKSCTHRIVFFGDNLPIPEASGVDNYDPYSNHAYYWFPLVLYHAFSNFRFSYPRLTLAKYAAQFNVGPESRIPRWIQKNWEAIPENPTPGLYIDRYDESFWSEPIKHLVADPFAVLHDGSGELPPNVLEEMGSWSEDAKKPSSDGNSWTATLMLLEYVNRIPAVPVPTAAKLLQITEKTVYNQCGKKLECIPHRGTTWVTKRSIRAWVAKLYRPTAEFNLWDKVMAEVEKNPAVNSTMLRE